MRTRERADQRFLTPETTPTSEPALHRPYLLEDKLTSEGAQERPCLLEGQAQAFTGAWPSLGEEKGRRSSGGRSLYVAF